MSNRVNKGLGNRIFDFAVNVIKFTKLLNYTIENKIITNQLIKSATSVGANNEEHNGQHQKQILEINLKYH